MFSNGLTDDDPELPEHDESTPDAGRSHLCGVDRDCSILCADTNSHDESRSEEALPGLCESGTDRRGSETASGNENLASSTKVVVEWIDNESAAVN